MSVFRELLMALGQKPRLPSAYQEVEYIKGTGSQYIDTNFVATGGMTCEYIVSYDSNDGYQEFVVGSHSLNSPYGRNGAYYSDEWGVGTRWELGYGDYTLRQSTTITFGKKYNVEFSTVVGNAYLKVDGTTLLTNTTNQTISPTHVMLFGNAYIVNQGGPYTTAKLYYAKIYNSSGELVRELIPCYKKSNNAIGVYDMVNDLFYQNNGSGTFEKGPDVGGYTPSPEPPEPQNEYQEVEYIQSTGTQYLDSGISCSGGIKCQYKASFQNNGYICGAHNTYSPYGRCGGYALGNGRWELGYGEIFPQAGISSLNTIYEVEFQTTYSDAYLKVKGGNYNDWTTITSTSGQNVTSMNALIFAQQYVLAHGEAKTQAKLYYLKIYDSNGALKGDFVPCYRVSDEKVGLLNRVTEEFITNLGTGELVKGPDVE